MTSDEGSAAPVAIFAIEQIRLCKAPEPEHVVHDLSPAPQHLGKLLYYSDGLM